MFIKIKVCLVTLVLTQYLVGYRRIIVPRRSNEFQKLIFVLYRQLFKKATVKESMFLQDKDTGSNTEVDITINYEINGKPAIIGVECTAMKRKADILWYRAMVKKHEDLPLITKTVLVSKSGFTKQVYEKAKKNNVEVLTLEQAENFTWDNFVKKIQNGTLVHLEFSVVGCTVTLNKEEVNNHNIILNNSSEVVIGTNRRLKLVAFLNKVVKEEGVTKAILMEYPKIKGKTNSFEFSFIPLVKTQLITEDGTFVNLNKIKAIYIFKATESSKIHLNNTSHMGKGVAYASVENVINKGNHTKMLVVVNEQIFGEVKVNLVVPKNKGDDSILKMEILGKFHSMF